MNRPKLAIDRRGRQDYHAVEIELTGVPGFRPAGDTVVGIVSARRAEESRTISTGGRLSTVTRPLRLAGLLRS